MDFDVIIAGAGPAGCITARDLARNGFQVGLFDTAPKEKLGKPIVVELEKSVFNRVGIPAPVDDEIPYHPGHINVFSSRGVHAFDVNRAPSVAIYLDRFVKKLLVQTEAAGVRFFSGYKAKKPVQDGNRICGAVFVHNKRREEVRARLVIDATGYEAALVRSLDPSLGIDFCEDPADVVLAASYLYDIHPDRAAEAVSRGIHGDEELRISLGLFGSYSTEFSHLSLQKRQAYILIGHKNDVEVPPMHSLISRFKQSQGYCRKRVLGDKGRIRIAHALDRLVCNGFMAVGEAGSMVIPINGSGVSTGLLAGQTAAHTASQALNLGSPSTETLWPFASEYQRGRGAVLATFDVMRRATENLNSEQVADMLEAGLSGPEEFVNANMARPLFLSTARLPQRIRSLAAHPDLIRPLLKAAITALAVLRHYRRYPETFDPPLFEAWKEKTRRLFSGIAS